MGVKIKIVSFDPDNLTYEIKSLDDQSTADIDAQPSVHHTVVNRGADVNQMLLSIANSEFVDITRINLVNQIKQDTALMNLLNSKVNDVLTYTDQQLEQHTAEHNQRVQNTDIFHAMVEDFDPAPMWAVEQILRHQFEHITVKAQRKRDGTVVGVGVDASTQPDIDQSNIILRNHDVLDAMCNRLGVRSINEIIDTPTATKEELTALWISRYGFDIVNGINMNFGYTPFSLQLKKNAKKSVAKAKAFSESQKNITLAAGTFEADEDTVKELSRIVAALGAGWSLPANFEWEDVNGNVFNPTANQLNGLLNKINERNDGLRQQYRVHAANIEALTTEQQIIDYVISYT